MSSRLVDEDTMIAGRIEHAAALAVLWWRGAHTNKLKTHGIMLASTCAARGDCVPWWIATVMWGAAEPEYSSE